MKILVADALDPTAVSLLKEKDHEVLEKEVTPQELKEIIGQYHALIVRGRTKVTSDIISAGKNLKVIGRAGVGVDNIDIDAASEKKIPVVYAPTGSTQSVAEHTIGMIFAVARRISYADQTMKEDKWLKKQIKGIELSGKTLGFIGSGRIGAAVAKIAQAMGMETISYDPYLPIEIAEKVGIKLTDFETVLKTADIISIHAALTPETKGMVGHDQFSLMKPSAILVNCARGGIVNEKALFEALQNKNIFGAALDVFETEPPEVGYPLLKLENIVLTPHIAASTKDAQLRAGTITIQQVLLVLNGQSPKYCVNEDKIK